MAESEDGRFALQFLEVLSIEGCRERLEDAKRG